jgi:hypothetical protein
VVINETLRTIENLRTIHGNFRDQEISPQDLAILAAQTACVAAKSLGIDSLFTQRGLHRRDITQVFRLLNLPDQYCFPLVALVLGYAKTEPAFKKGRLREKSVIHWEAYQPLTSTELDALILQYNNKSEHLGLIENWEETGAEHYLDWLFNKWFPRASFDTRALMAALKKSGFLP